jgi:aminocarboxymuconate-semialdehyde decarboxylase
MNRYLTIDMHTSFIPESYLEYLEKHSDHSGVGVSTDDAGLRYMVPRRPIPVYGMQPVPVMPAHWDIDVRLENMTSTGVDVQALSVPTTLFNYWQKPALGLELSRTINDAIAEAVRQHPKRFVGIATVPLQNPDLAVAELERAVTELGMRAVEIGSSVNEWELDNQALRPFWEAAESLDVPVYIHGNEVPGFDRMTRWFLAALLGIPVASTLALTNLIFGGVLEAYPRLALWLPHGGGVYPYLRGRMDHVYAIHMGANQAIPRPPSTYLNQVYFDSILFYEPALSYMLEVMGEDHVMLGTDYPFSVGQLDGASFLHSHPALSESARQKLLSENALGLLGMNKADFLNQGN